MVYYHSSFEDVKFILDANDCNSCHSSQNNFGGWNYDSYSSFLSNGDCNEKMILHGDASNSYFYRKLSGADACNVSSNNIHQLSEEEFSQIESWINFGAPEYCVSFYDDIRTLLDNNQCNSCHTANPQSWRYDSYLNMIDNNLDDNCKEANIIVKGNSATSLLFDKINNDGFVSCGDPMNAQSGPMSYEDVALIRDWINSGANETSASLPVILTNFSVEDNQGDIELSWSTEIEIATEKFIVERSQTGQHFESIAEKTSEGSPTTGNDYKVTDPKPIIGDNYYRLKIVDLDGSFNYSNIRLIRVKSAESIITVYPNPAVSRERIDCKVDS